MLPRMGCACALGQRISLSPLEASALSPPLPSLCLEQVVSVDRTVHPPSYGVELPDGSYRETEAHRLLPRQPGAAPPPAANGHHAPGSWAAAAASPFDQPAGGPAKAAAAVAAPPPAAVAAAAAGPAAAAAAEDEEDDFGEWAAAGALPLPAAQAAAPRPAAAAAAPGSPRREGAMVHAVPASAHGSPQRLPTRSSGALRRTGPAIAAFCDSTALASLLQQPALCSHICSCGASSGSAWGSVLVVGMQQPAAHSLHRRVASRTSSSAYLPTAHLLASLRICCSPALAGAGPLPLVPACGGTPGV